MFSIKFAAHFPRLTLCNQKNHDPCTWCSRRGFKVAVVGAAGGVGQPLSLLLKQNPQITTLALQDKVNVKGIATDLSHICTSAVVESYDEKDLSKALNNAAIVVVSAGMPRKPGMTTEQLFQENAKVVTAVAKEISKSCPDALLAFITSPVNMIVPMVAKQLMEEDAYDPGRLFGVTTLDVVRAKTIIGESIGIDPLQVSIPVVGGHGKTTLPLISQSNPKFDGSPAERVEVVQRIQEAGVQVAKAKVVTLSMAYAGANFVNSLLRALNNEKNVIECAFVQSDVSEAQFLASPVLLGPKGIVENLGLPDLDEFEEDAMRQIVESLIKDIDQGLKLPLC
ncbi:malate dehydrogenase, mitochondrial-like [Drosophila innubila]|uniref:malate dehydrogenase, mitochondrial-like n=1 Tax=Drosophila innubila TaxID=198719 RepID=UPI00148C34B0|nr:malate dehydrogenase, mitochondrial-like [Drosophila innubila]